MSETHTQSIPRRTNLLLQDFVDDVNRAVLMRLVLSCLAEECLVFAFECLGKFPCVLQVRRFETLTGNHIGSVDAAPENDDRGLISLFNRSYLENGPAPARFDHPTCRLVSNVSGRLYCSCSQLGSTEQNIKIIVYGVGGRDPV
jgi:hypothetical protein